jgi:hypothetical protein
MIMWEQLTHVVGSALREKPNSMAGSKDIGSSATMDDVAVGGYGRHAQPPVIVVARASQIKVCSRLTPGTGLTIILDRGARRAGLERIQQKSPAASSAPGANRSATYLWMKHWWQSSAKRSGIKSVRASLTSGSIPRARLSTPWRGESG